MTQTGEGKAVDQRLSWASHRLSKLSAAAESFLPLLDTDHMYAAAAVASVTYSNISQPSLGLMAGEVIHHLRASLDNLVWEITPAPHRSRKTAFPIRDTEARFNQAAASNLRGLPSSVVAAVRKVQPFVPEHQGGLANGGGALLKLLDDFWNDDKHRIPTVAIGTLQVFPPGILTAGTDLIPLARSSDARREVYFVLERNALKATVETFAHMHLTVGEVVRRVRDAC